MSKRVAAVKRAVFLDRDGTMIEDRDYLHKPEEVVILPGIPEALQRLQEGGFLLIMITNQSGVGRGFFSMTDVERVHEHISKELARHKVVLRKIYVAPEAPDQPSRGRKPSPQFLFDAHDEFGIEISQSYMVGDKLIDLECGWNAGVKKSILVRTGYGAKVEQSAPGRIREAVVVNDFAAAANWILSDGS